MAIIIDIQPVWSANQPPVWLQVFSAVLVLLALIAFIWKNFIRKKSIEEMSEDEIAVEQLKKVKAFASFLVKIEKDPTRFKLSELANHPDPAQVAAIIEKHFFKLIEDNEDPATILGSMNRLMLRPRQRFNDDSMRTLYFHTIDRFKKRYQDMDAREKLLAWKASNNQTPFSVWFDLKNQTILPIPESTQINVRKAYEVIERVEEESAVLVEA